MRESLERGRAIVGPRGWRPQAAALLLALPAALLFRAVAFRFPEAVETLYVRGMYPVVAALLGGVSGLVPISLAELLAPLVTVGAFWLLVRAARGATPGRRRHLRGLGRALLMAWGLAGAAAWVFLLVWGLNYARPPLQQRLGLDVGAIEAPEVLELGRRLAARAAALREGLADAGPDDNPGSSPGPASGAGIAPLRLPMGFAELDVELDRALRRLDLAGDPLGSAPAPAKRLLTSRLFAHLGISGIYVPFTAEPSVNRLLPDAALPVAVGHEKAHQRGITDEGEANLVGVLACLAADDPHVRYAGYLDASARLIGAAGVYLPADAREAWQALGPGAMADLRHIREFWESYRGVATEVAGRVNDAYLRSNRVPGGIESYGHVVRLLVGAERAGLLLPGR